MGTRLELQTLLETKLGSRNVYFQPSESIKMSYPAIVYEFSRVETKKADDIKYLFNNRYSITYISRNPDNTMVSLLLQLPYCSYDRRFIVDNLYHDVFDLYF